MLLTQIEQICSQWITGVVLGRIHVRTVKKGEGGDATTEGAAEEYMGQNPKLTEPEAEPAPGAAPAQHEPTSHHLEKRLQWVREHYSKPRLSGSEWESLNRLIQVNYRTLPNMFCRQGDERAVTLK
jgi:hypothetical protein